MPSQTNYIYIFVEGNDDERFFERIIAPFVKKWGVQINIVKYAKMSNDKRNNFIRSIKSINEYIFFTDIDNSPCISRKKEIKRREIRSLDEEKVLVVIKEIESWYLAGVKDDFCQRYNMQIPSTTDNLTKEAFNSLIPRKFRDSRIDFMIELLNNFSIDIAKSRNRSFKYFIEKLTRNFS